MAKQIIIFIIYCFKTTSRIKSDYQFDYLKIIYFEREYDRFDYDLKNKQKSLGIPDDLEIIMIINLFVSSLEENLNLIIFHFFLKLSVNSL